MHNVSVIFGINLAFLAELYFAVSSTYHGFRPCYTFMKSIKNYFRTSKFVILFFGVKASSIVCDLVEKSGQAFYMHFCSIFDFGLHVETLKVLLFICSSSSS